MESKGSGLKSDKKKLTPEEVEDYCLTLLEASTISIDLSPNEGDYDVSYIKTKLVACGVTLEKLGAAVYNLLKLSILVTKEESRLRTQLEVEEGALKGTVEYESLPRDCRSGFLAERLGVKRKNLSEWRTAMTVLHSSKEALDLAIGTLKRIDSDLRLHHKVIETGVRLGSMDPGVSRSFVREKDLQGESSEYNLLKEGDFEDLD